MKHACVALLCLVMISISTKGQEPNVDSLHKAVQVMPQDSSRVKVLVEISRAYYNSDPIAGYNYAYQALLLAEKLDYEAGKAQALKFCGLSKYKSGDLIDALDYYNASMRIFESMNDQVGKANILSNIGAMYIEQGDEEKGLEYLLQSLAISEKMGDKLRIATAMINIGTIYINKPSTYDKALGYFYKALYLSRQINNKAAISTALVNLGETYFNKHQKDSALFYFNRSIYDAEDDETICYSLIMMGNTYLQEKDYANASAYFSKAFERASTSAKKLEMTKSLVGLGNTYRGQLNNDLALKAFGDAEQLARELSSPYDLKEVFSGYASTYAQKGDYQKAFIYQNLLNDIKDTIYNIQTEKKLSNLQLDFEIEKKQGQINLLTKDAELQAVELRRQKFATNSAIVGLTLLILIAFILYHNYKVKMRTNRILDKQKDEIETLLLNILPTEVARELQATGKSTPKYYEKVSVLFTDFKSFSRLADHLSPQQIIEELNTYFTRFDSIIEKYNLEKIKTIGDAYMCAGGVPIENNSHALDIVKASLEIQEFAEAMNIERRLQGRPDWGLRIGIHTGPVIAGVVGNKKYAYDIWGSTVNIANRMESNGEPGQVNISASTYELIRDQFSCTYRGKITAKNIGEVDMYFVDHAIIDKSTISIIVENPTVIQSN